MGKLSSNVPFSFPPHAPFLFSLVSDKVRQAHLAVAALLCEWKIEV